MINIEGTKHEKVVLIILAYIIGFTSGLIAFGMAASDYEVPYDDSVSTNVFTDPSAEDFSALARIVPPTIQTMNTGSTSVTYEDGRLYATVNTEKILLSISRGVAGDQPQNDFTEQGIHVAVPTYSISADGRFIYFCEQQSDEPTCASFVYDTLRSIIHFVSAADQKLQTTNDIALTASWTLDNTLQVGDYSSLATDTPWNVIQQ